MPPHAKRIRAVHDSGLLDIRDNREFQDLVDVVKMSLKCPVSVVSILDENRQVFIGHVGLPGDWAQTGETPLTHSFCQHVVDDQQPFAVNDARIHRRVQENLAIDALGVVSYLGVPVTLPDETVIGALAVIDGTPRQWTEEDLRLLKQFGKVASNQIATAMSERRWSSLFEQLQEGIVTGTVIRDDDGRIVDWRYDSVNTAWGKFLDSANPQAGRSVRELLPEIDANWASGIAEAVDGGEPLRFTHQEKATNRWFDGYLQATSRESFIVIFVEVTERVAAAEALRQSEARLRLLVRGARDYAILTIDTDHRISSWYGGAEDTFGRSEAEMVGKPFADIFVPADRAAGVPQAEIETAAMEGVAVDSRWHQKQDGSRVFLDGTVRPLPADPDGEIRGFIKIARNATAERHAADRQIAFLKLGDLIRELESVPEVAFAATETLARTLVGATRAGYGVVDPVAETVSMLPGWTAPDIPTIDGLHHFRDYGSFIEDLKRGETVTISDVATDPRTAASADLLRSIGISVLVNVPIIEHGAFVGVMFVHYDAPHDFSSEERDFVRTIADRTREAISRIRAEEEQQVLNHEISHRLKNTMAMVQAIAMQTLRPIADRAPVEAFTSRLHALSKAHEVLLHQDWSSARMTAVMDSVLRQLSLPERYEISGPDLELGPRTALSLALLMHELGTNALKYGAWSTASGKVSIRWHTEPVKDDDALIMTWEESGGPPVEQPSGRGFGSKLIRLGLMGTGAVDIRYEPTGIHVEMRGLVSQLRQS